MPFPFGDGGYVNYELGSDGPFLSLANGVV